jgi:hypothetical protein
VRVSVALCTYNGGAHVREQLASILAQDPAPAEVVVCDDGSTDGTLDIVREVAAGSQVPFRIEANAEQLGSTRNFIRAVRLCGGDIVALADQDDVWLPHKLARLVPLFERPEVTGAFSDARLVDARLGDLGHTLWETLAFDPPTSPEAMLRLLQERNVVTGATLAVRREVGALAAPVPESPLFLHDWWLGLLAAATGELVPVAEPLILYRQHSAQQVGAALGGPRSRKAEGIGRTEAYAGTIEALKAAVDRLGAPSPPVAPRPGALQALLDQLAHLERRTSLPRGRLRRLPLVAAELARGRYRRWSRGLVSAARDLLA